MDKRKAMDGQVKQIVSSVTPEVNDAFFQPANIGMSRM